MVGDAQMNDAPAFVRQNHQDDSRRHVAVGTTKKSAAAICTM
jgi:hypothetical protein